MHVVFKFPFGEEGKHQNCNRGGGVRLERGRDGILASGDDPLGVWAGPQKMTVRNAVRTKASGPSPVRALYCHKVLAA